ncbi:hypothetical protein O3P69_019745 [Scylla paramamosain]|uniref:WD repeat-containing protein 47 n=1 Tax=Scylla paramamosain TaxID=85552 RepID=A0AAW0SXZ6_SCYPA
MSRSLNPALDGLPFGLGGAGRGGAGLAGSAGDLSAMSRSMASFHLTGRRGMNASVDRLFEADSVFTSVTQPSAGPQGDLPPITERPRPPAPPRPRPRSRSPDKRHSTDSLNRPPDRAEKEVHEEKPASPSSHPPQLSPKGLPTATAPTWEARTPTYPRGRRDAWGRPAEALIQQQQQHPPCIHTTSTRRITTTLYHQGRPHSSPPPRQDRTTTTPTPYTSNIKIICQMLIIIVVWRCGVDASPCRHTHSIASDVWSSSSSSSSMPAVQRRDSASPASTPAPGPEYKLVRREVRRSSLEGAATPHGVGEAREEVLARLDQLFEDLAVTRREGRHCEVEGRRPSTATGAARRPSSMVMPERRPSGATGAERRHSGAWATEWRPSGQSAPSGVAARRPSSGTAAPRRASTNGTLATPEGGSACFRSPPRGDLFSQRSTVGVAAPRRASTAAAEEERPEEGVAAPRGYRRDSLEVEALLGRRMSLYDAVIPEEGRGGPHTRLSPARSLRPSPSRTTPPPRASPSRATPPRTTPPRTTPPRTSPSRGTPPPRASPERTCLTRVNQGVLLTAPSTGNAPLDCFFPPPQSGKDGGGDSGGAKPRFLAVTSLEDVQAVRCAEFHPSGRFYAVGSNSKTLRICAYPKLSDLREDHNTYQPTVLYKRTKHHKGSIYCLAWSPLGDLIATGSNDKTVKLMRFNADACSMDGQEIELAMHDGTVRDMCFVEDTSNKSSLLISGGAGDCKIYVTDCATGTPFQALSGHTGHILALHTWGGAMFVSGSQDRTVRFWDLRTRGCVNVITPAATPTKACTCGAPVASLCVDPSGRLLVTGHEDAVCCLFDVRGSRIIQAFRPHGADVRSIRFSPSAYYLLTAGYDNKLVLTDLQGDLTLPLPSVVIFTFISTSADKLCTLWALPPV